MRVLLITQDENVYLPAAIARVCRGIQDRIVCIVAAPAMSTHGGAFKGFRRHLGAFGFRATATLAWRTLYAKLRAKVGGAPEGRFYSLAHVARYFALPYEYANKVNGPEFHSLVDRYKPDLLISMSCPQIIGQKVRQRFGLGCINVHGAPLPKYRGLMPTFWALRNQESRTASTVHDLADKLDNGAILLQREVQITPDDTWDSLVRKTKTAGADALIEVVGQIENQTVRRLPNRDEDATYFSFPTAADRKAFLKAGRKFF
jgi:methionyl-tRNA formyltransferase